MKDFPIRSVLSLKPLIDYLQNEGEQSDTSAPFIDLELKRMLHEAPEFHKPIENPAVLKRHPKLLQRLMGQIFPPAFWEMEPTAAVVPFIIEPVYVSPEFKRLFLEKDGSPRGTMQLGEQAFNSGRLVKAYLFILKKFYNIELNLEYPIIKIVSDPDTGLDRHFKMKMDFRFVDAYAVKEPKVLTDAEREAVLEHLTDPEILQAILPPDHFEIRGFTVLQAVDVTETEVLSALERDLVNQETVISQQGFKSIQKRLKTLFKRPDLTAGLAVIQKDQVLLLNKGCAMEHCCIYADSHHVPISDFQETIFEKAVEEKRILRVPDILKDPSTKQVKDALTNMGVRCILVSPLFFQGDCIGTLLIGSPEPGSLGPIDAMVVEQIQPLFASAIKRALDDLENRVQNVIKQECTAVHPSVEWRFREAAFHSLENMRMGKASEIEPIIFKDVYPLYGVSDIRGSAFERNRSLQKDLSEHLDLALEAVGLAYEARPFLILKELAGRIEDYQTGIRSGLSTGDELAVVKFLREEVETVFPLIKGFGPKVIRAIGNYEKALDPKVGTVYRLRKEFEESVYLLNERLANYLDKEEAKAQAIIPHYFERHRTDGVDHLIYAGASLMENGQFDAFYLKELRLWQLKVTCGMAWHTEQLKATQKVPLDTAHLILMQDTPLSIRFRYDEKKFDVDGAYDVRQEIIKSRLDKAVIKGKAERLTQPGKISVVFSYNGEAEEIERHVHFLRSKGYLTDEIEHLDLEDLPGVQGLRALRVGVNLESQVHELGSEKMAFKKSLS